MTREMWIILAQMYERKKTYVYRLIKDTYAVNSKWKDRDYHFEEKWLCLPDQTTYQNRAEKHELFSQAA